MGVRKGIIESAILGLSVAFAYLYIAPNFVSLLTRLNWPVNVETEGTFLALYFALVFLFAKWVSYRYR